MSIKKTSRIIRKIIPGSIFKILRTLGTAILTPIFFSYRTGHFHSSILNKPVDKCGEPIPWYTYPAIYFLSNKDFKDKDILEWGAGHSTLWWSKRAKSVTSIESDKKWFNYIKKMCPLINTNLLYISNDIENIDQHIKSKKFDLIIIDGPDRFDSICKSLAWLSQDGAIIVDDLESCLEDTEPEYSILNLLQEKKFTRIDFHGYAPGVIQPHCTSLFFNKSCFLFNGTEQTLCSQ